MTIDEKNLTKGQIRKLNALRKSVGDSIGEKAFESWFKSQPVNGGSEPVDKNAELVAATLGKLCGAGKLRIQRGGYLVTRGRGRVIVSAPESE